MTLAVSMHCSNHQAVESSLAEVSHGPDGTLGAGGTAPGAGLGDRRIPGRSGQRASGRMIQNSCFFGGLSSAFPDISRGTLSKGVDDPEFPAVQTLWALQAVRDQEHLALAG